MDANAKVLFTVRYTHTQITALTFFAITKSITKIAAGNGIAESVKSWNLHEIVSKFDLGLLHTYNPMYFDRNISENKDDKKNEGSFLSFVTNG